MRKAKSNLGCFGGTVTDVKSFPSQNHPNEVFGSINIVMDNGYFDKKANNGNGEYVERPCFVKVKMDNRCFKQCGGGLTVGDQIVLQASLMQDSWNDSQTGEKRTELILKCEDVLSHVEKGQIEVLKANNAYSNTNTQPNPHQQQGGFQQPQQGGFQQPQQGGFQQPQQGGFQRPSFGQQ